MSSGRGRSTVQEARRRPWRGDAILAGVRAGLPIAFAVLVLAVSFGLLAEPLLGTAGTIVMSVLVFAGSAQFGAIAVLAAGGGAASAIAAGVLLNARYVPMGIALAPSLRGSAARRAAYGQAMVDASWALANRGGGRFDPDFMVGATIPSYPAWVGGTAIGLFAGELVADPEALGLDALFPAFFLALLVNEIRARHALAAAIMGAALALALTPFAPAGLPILLSGAAALIGLFHPPEPSERLEAAPAEDPWQEAQEGP